jgi:hypothetical protein
MYGVQYLIINFLDAPLGFPVLVQDLQEVLVYTFISTEAILDFVHIVDCLVKFDRLLSGCQLLLLLLLLFFSQEIFHANLKALQSN